MKQSDFYEPYRLYNTQYSTDDIKLCINTNKPFIPKTSHKRTNKKRQLDCAVHSITLCTL